MSLKDYQAQILQNKRDHYFNTTNLETEFLLLYGEVSEAFRAYQQEENIGDELADVAIYLLGIAEILGIDLETEIIKKMAVNKKRKYQLNDQGYAKRVED
ncbi:MAG TPA: MazG-like family protein [Tetragenococcus sp.]|nr:MazG-like family protein [Tetragenococcus sp.]